MSRRVHEYPLDAQQYALHDRFNLHNQYIACKPHDRLLWVPSAGQYLGPLKPTPKAMSLGPLPELAKIPHLTEIYELKAYVDAVISGSATLDNNTHTALTYLKSSLNLLAL